MCALYTHICIFIFAVLYYVGRDDHQGLLPEEELSFLLLNFHFKKIMKCFFDDTSVLMHIVLPNYEMCIVVRYQL